MTTAAWLVDERLAFHDYLASDKTLAAMPITGSVSGKEPDIVALNVFNNPVLVSAAPALPLASIVVIELKRPSAPREMVPSLAKRRTPSSRR